MRALDYSDIKVGIKFRRLSHRAELARHPEPPEISRKAGKQGLCAKRCKYREPGKQAGEWDDLWNDLRAAHNVVTCPGNLFPETVPGNFLAFIDIPTDRFFLKRIGK